MGTQPLYFWRPVFNTFIGSWPNSREIVNLFRFKLGPWETTIGTKFTISCEFGPVHVKWWCHVFSNMKKEGYMKSELSGIYRVKAVTKNILLGSLETLCQAVLALSCLFLSLLLYYRQAVLALSCLFLSLLLYYH